MTYASYARGHGLLTAAGAQAVAALEQACAAAWDAAQGNASADWRAVDATFNEVEAEVVRQSNANVYDVRRMDGQYDFTFLTDYLRRGDVRAALGVDPRAAAWAPDSAYVGYLLEAGEQSSAAPLYASLLGAGVRVLVYNGAFDMDCNVLGTDAWLTALAWPGAEDYAAAERRPYAVHGTFVGTRLQVRNLPRCSSPARATWCRWTTAPRRWRCSRTSWARRGRPWSSSDGAPPPFKAPPRAATFAFAACRQPTSAPAARSKNLASPHRTLVLV